MHTSSISSIPSTVLRYGTEEVTSCCWDKQASIPRHPRVCRSVYTAENGQVILYIYSSPTAPSSFLLILILIPLLITSSEGRGYAARRFSQRLGNQTIYIVTVPMTQHMTVSRAPQNRHISQVYIFIWSGCITLTLLSIHYLLPCSEPD